MFNISEEQKKQLLQYFWAKPYGEVAALIGMLANLKPTPKSEVLIDDHDDDGKK